MRKGLLMMIYKEKKKVGKEVKKVGEGLC